MVTIEQVKLEDKKSLNEFLNLPFKIYKNNKQWVPPILNDVRDMLDKTKHPFYDHSEADFFMARKDGEVVGRIAALQIKPYNAYHGTRQGQFYLFECIDDQEVANALFNRVFEWAKERDLNEIVGPKGLSPFDGYGIQIEGFEYRQMMTMMNYNPEYYIRLVENIGFEKEVDFVSCYIPREKFILPEKVHRVAERVIEKGTFEVKRFTKRSEMREFAKAIGEAYNQTFVNNWEYYPLTKRDVDYTIDNIISVADPRLIKLILADGKVVGFLFGFPDVSAALQRAKGHLTPWALIDLLIDMKRTKWVSMNGAGILPEFHGRGGNALLYAEMDKTIHDFNFDHFELTQVAETAVQMRKDLINLGGKAYKNHRVYYKHI